MTTKEELQELIEKSVYQKGKLFDDKVILDEKGQHNLNFLLQKMPEEKIKNKTIFDIGCNIGLFPLVLKQMGAKYAMGLDHYSDAIDLAVKIRDFLKIDVDYRNEPFNDAIIYEGRFDLMLCMSCYHYLFRDYKSHRRLFQIFYQLCDELFFEDAICLDEDEWVNKMFNTPELENWKSEYTKEKFFSEANKYFDIEYLGRHLGGKREIYWMKRKTNINKEDRIEEIIFHNKETKTTIKKIEDDNGNFLCLKTLICNEDNIKFYENSYKLYEKIKDIPEITKVYKTWEENGLFHVLSEYHDGYKNIYHYENSFYLSETEHNMVFLNGYKDYKYRGRKFTKTEKTIIYQKVMYFLAHLASKGTFFPDFGLKNFMINRDLDIKAIDLDFIVPLEAYTSDEKITYNDKPYLLNLFFTFMRLMFIWLKDNNSVFEEKNNDPLS